MTATNNKQLYSARHWKLSQLISAAYLNVSGS